MILPLKVVSRGSVSNIIDGWRHNLGIPLADELLDLAIILKKLNITSVQCRDQ